jgi:hypothetical protein
MTIRASRMARTAFRARLASRLPSETPDSPGAGGLDQTGSVIGTTAKMKAKHMPDRNRKWFEKTLAAPNSALYAYA